MTGRGTFRRCNDCRLPEPLSGGIVTVRLHSNDEDKQREFNRAENVRQIPPGDPDFEALDQRRNDAESIKRHLDDTLWLRRAHSVGCRRQLLYLCARCERAVDARAPTGPRSSGCGLIPHVSETRVRRAGNTVLSNEPAESGVVGPASGSTLAVAVGPASPSGEDRPGAWGIELVAASTEVAIVDTGARQQSTRARSDDPDRPG